MIERAGAALAEAAGEPFDGVSRRKYTGDAVALLEAIREPDPKVVARAMDRLRMPVTEVAKVVGIWTTMIDEILR